MLNNPTVSVIIPVFNGSKHIRTCLEAIFVSDYRDFECIVVDDGSKDDSLSIIKSTIKIGGLANPFGELEYGQTSSPRRICLRHDFAFSSQ